MLPEENELQQRKNVLVLLSADVVIKCPIRSGWSSENFRPFYWRRCACKLFQRMVKSKYAIGRKIHASQATKTLKYFSKPESVDREK